MKKILTLITVFAFILVSAVPASVQANSGGDGTPENPYQITNCVQLQEMNNNLNAYYVLMNDIDCSDTVNWNGGAGFVPIGNSSSPFSGTFDGQNHKIAGLFINRPSTDSVGLFGYVSGATKISNVGLVNVKITGGNFVGGLVGDNVYGTITSSYATGSVSGSRSVGGLVGFNVYGTITNSYATGSVSGSFVGGLVGDNYGNITNSYSTGSVTGTDYVGGLAGFHAGTITSSYATGSVTGTGFVGGLVSYNYQGTITNSYSTGSVTGTDYVSVYYLGGVGGLVSYNNQGTITNSYWDTETSGWSTSAGGAGKTTAEMKQPVTFVDWDFVNIWAIKEGVSYPYFLWQIPPVLTCPSGMVSYWKFDEGSGTTAYDSVGANHGILVNGPVWTTGKVGGALGFDGINDYLEMPNLIYGSSFSVGAWVKTTQTPVDLGLGDIATIIEEVGNGNDGGYQCSLQGGIGSSGGVRMYLNDGTTWSNGNAINTWSNGITINDGSWHYVVCMKDGGTSKIYIDGVFNNIGDVSSLGDTTDVTSGGTRIGGLRNGQGQFFEGTIDEVAVYNRALSTEEIQQQYQNGLNGKGYCDTTPPVTTAELSGTVGKNGWYVSDVQVSLTATDNEGGSGVAKTEYSFDGITWNTYTAPFMVSTEGTTTVYYRSTDKAGNVEETKTEAIKIDKTRPNISGSRDPLPNTDGWNNTSVTVLFNASDTGGSGIDMVTPDEVVSQEGQNQSVTGTATDKAGNSNSCTVAGINIDKTPPIISGSITPAPNPAGWNNSNATVSFSASDSLSGVASKTPDQVISSEGPGQIISGEAMDKAGNKATTQVTVNIDKSSPTVSITATPNVLWPPNQKMIDVKISGSAIDAISGIASLTFKVKDEYDKVEPAISGFGSSIQLEAWRNGNDRDGRLYIITVTVKDNAGNESTASTTVLVPLYQGK